jgi:hypothetical protein
VLHAPAVAKGNGQDRALQRLEVRRRLARLSPRDKLDALIDAPNSGELVRSMRAEDLYHAILDVGLSDTTDIVQLASPSQFRAFVDLAAWKRDRMDPHQLLTWLRAARGEDPEEFLAKLSRLDLELLELMLRSFTVIHDLEEDPDVNPEGVTMESPEGKYLIEFTVDGVELASLRQLLHDLYGRDAFGTVRLLEATRWEVPIELEEAAYRFRSARLEDLGFPPFDEALGLFSWVDPNTVQWERPKAATAPQAALRLAGGRADFVQAAMDELTDSEQEGFQIELRNVANKALVAETADPGDLDALRRVGELVRDYLNLGLEHLCDQDVSLAAEVVRQVPTAQVFKVGFSLTLRLKFRADRLARQPLSRLGEVWMLLPEVAAAVVALRRKRPMRALPVEGADPVPFRSRRELAEADLMLTTAEAQVALFRGLLGGTEASARQVLDRFAQPLELLDTRRLLAGAVGHAVLHKTVRLQPIPSLQVPRLLEQLFEGTAQAPRLSVAAQGVPALLGAGVDPSHRPGAEAAVAAVLDRLLGELAAAWLQEGSVDPSVGEVLPICPGEGR